MSSARRQTLRPVVVEVRPDHAPSSIAPSSPSPSSSPKAVRFAPTSANTSSRPLSSTEAWSLYHFEIHARACAECFDPYHVFRKGGALCHTGHGLAQDVACHVYHKEGDVYSARKDDAKLVRVEVPHGYDQTRLLLRAMERRLRSHRRSTPVVSYDRSYPVSARRYHSSGSIGGEDEDDVLILEPARSEPAPRKSKHKPLRYSTVVVQERAADDDDAAAVPTLAPAKERRGTLYEKDMQRKKENYRVEIREPDRRRRSDDGRRQSVWL